MNKAEKAVVLTWLLVPMLIGVFIGGAVSGNTSLMIWSAVLFFADMAVGSLLKRRAERQTEEEVWNIWRGMSSAEKSAAANELLDRLRQELNAHGINVGRPAAGSSGCEENGEGNAERLKSGERLEELCRTLRNGSGAHFGKEATVIPGTRRVRSIGEDEAGRFLLGFCRLIPHAPLPNTLSRLWLVSAGDLDGAPALLYTFHHDRHSVCQNAEIILVHTGNGKIRLFVLETDYSAYVLCEYDENRHINYGRIAMEDFLPRVRELLKQPVPPIPL